MITAIIDCRVYKYKERVKN